MDAKPIRKQFHALNQSELRTLIRSATKRPFRLCLDDGKTYLISHPDFALASTDGVMLVSGPGHKFGAPFVICDYAHITRVEVSEKAGKQ